MRCRRSYHATVHQRDSQEAFSISPILPVGIFLPKWKNFTCNIFTVFALEASFAKSVKIALKNLEKVKEEF